MGGLYSSLVATLRTDILGGKYRVGQPFPSVRALSHRYGCSDATAQRVQDELFRQGLISRKQGRGTFVTGQGCWSDPQATGGMRRGRWRGW